MANAESKSSLIIPGQGPERQLRVAGRAAPCAPCISAVRAAKCSRRPVDYFTFFGFPRKLNLDTAALEKEFYALSRRLHPDVCARRRGTRLEPGTKFHAQRRLPHAERSDQAHRYLLRLEGIELEEQSKQATEKARATGELKKQVVPPDLLEEVFELNMHLEELRTQKKMGEDDPALLEEIGKAKLSLEEKYDALFNELKAEWKKWDKSWTAGPTEADRRRSSTGCWMC
jgi:molecular chaperone HscB